MSPELSEIQIKSIERSGNKANITFLADPDSNGFFQLFCQDYQGTQGNKFELNSERIRTGLDKKMENHLAVLWSKDNKVILRRSMSPMIKLEQPVEITLKD